MSPHIYYQPTTSFLFFFSDDDDVTEVEDNVPPSSIVELSLPLMRVHRCDQDDSSIELTVHTGRNIPSSSHNNNSNNNNCDIRLKLLSSISMTAEENTGITSCPTINSSYDRPQELATLLGEHLHSALRLHLWSTYRPPSEVISLI